MFTSVLSFQFSVFRKTETATVLSVLLPKTEN